MSIDEMSREELLEYKNRLLYKRLEVTISLRTKTSEEMRELDRLQIKYRKSILDAIEEIKVYIDQYYCNKMTLTSLGSKKSYHERLKLLIKSATMYELYNYLFKNDMDEYLFDPKTYTFQDQEETIEKRNYDLELYEELESKIPGVMDAYFDAKVTYCKVFPDIKKRKTELASTPITEEDEIHMKQKLNLIEMEIASVERVLKAKEMELKL